MLHIHNKNRLAKDAGLYFLSALVIAIAFSFPAQAQIGETLCAMYSMLQSNVGRGLATLAIAILGIGAMLGKVSWGMAILVGVGIGALFGADTIYTTITQSPSCFLA